MLKFLCPAQPPRTTISPLDTILLDDGRSKITFHKLSNLHSTASSISGSSSCSSEGYLVTNTLPPSPSPGTNPQATNSALSPPLHRHLYQTETFYIISGSARFFRYSWALETSELACAGDTVRIPPRQVHSFRNASTNEELVLQFRLDPATGDEERYFRNAQTYRDDCRKAGMQRSLPQVLLFNYYGGVVPAELLGASWVVNWLLRRFWIVGWVLNVLGGVVYGGLFLGLQGTYREYYAEEWNKDE